MSRLAGTNKTSQNLAKQKRIISRSGTNTQSGLTLVELIVAIAIMSIILLGIMAVNFAMQQSFQTASKNALVSMRVSAALQHISNNALIATGDITNEGIIVFDDSATGASHLFIRQDLNSPPDPTRYDDDTWVRYSHTLAANSPSTVMFCPDAPKNPLDLTRPDLTTPGDCTGNEYELIKVRNVAGGDLAGSGLNYEFVHDPAPDLNFYLRIAIRSWFNNSASSTHPTENPQQTVETSIIPLGHTYH